MRIKRNHLVFNRGVEKHCGLKPLVRVVAALNPFHCFIAACVQVNNQTTQRTPIHVIHKRQAIFTLNFWAQKPHIITLFSLTCFHVCKLSILIPWNKTKYHVKPIALALIRSCDLSDRLFTIKFCTHKSENPNGATFQARINLLEMFLFFHSNQFLYHNSVTTNRGEVCIGRLF